MTFVQQFVALTVATVKADREVKQAELDAVMQLAEGLNLDAAEVKSLIDAELSKNTSVVDIAKTVGNDTDKEVLFQSCVIVALADNDLCAKEVDLLSDICSAMSLPQSLLVLSVAAVCQNNRQIKIEGNESDFDQDELIVD